MNVEESTLKVDKRRAREHWRAYRQHVERWMQHDREAAAVYKLIAQGKTVIRALHAITQAGLNEDNRPNLAIARADQKFVRCMFTANLAHFEPMRNSQKARSLRAQCSMPGAHFSWPNLQSPVPLIPVHLRPPADCLHRYHVLFEADWKVYPVDPLLLRRIGRGDTWLVVAAWDLTLVELAVMQHRVMA